MSSATHIILVFLGANLIFEGVCEPVPDVVCLACPGVIKTNCPEGKVYSEGHCCSIGQKFFRNRCRTLLMDPTAKKKET
ncbi:hypothetical protein JTB14_012280 [Gonioctena quinquepunctata]|nr:hypothetical protein JTB14_012280 [Gonioctena quinquepunctata]